MSIDELIAILENTKRVHPEVKTIQAYTKDGQPTNNVGTHLRGGVLMVKGEST